MPKTRIPYRLHDGTIVPSVTTILSRFKESGGLMYWAWQQGQAGKDFREERDVAAEVGTMAHALVEAHIKGRDTPLFDAPLEMQTKARQAYENYLAFETQADFKVISLESPMVSEKYGYGGTPDALFESPDGTLSLGDWKTGRLYSDHLLQVVAYKVLWEENNPGRCITGGFHLCMFNKEYGDFSHHHYKELHDAWAMFSLLLQAYTLDKKLQARVK